LLYTLVFPGELEFILLLSVVVLDEEPAGIHVRLRILHD